MSRHDAERTFARRSFLSKLGIGLTAGGAGLGTAVVSAQTPGNGESGRWQSARHTADDWLDQIPGKHRLVLDTTTPQGFGDALAFLNNYFTVNQNAYGLQDADLAVVLLARHLSTLFAFNDSMWAKHGGTITQRTNFNDPKTKQPPHDQSLQLHHPRHRADQSRQHAGQPAQARIVPGGLPGVNPWIAGTIAMATGATADAVYNELVANLVSRNAHMVPAGIVAVNRAQERGYSLVAAG